MVIQAAAIRRLVIDALSRDELAALAQISTRILDHMENASPRSGRRALVVPPRDGLL